MQQAASQGERLCIHAAPEDGPSADVVPPPETWARRPKLVSVVVPVFREEENVVRFGEAVLRAFHALRIRCELLFVEDDSPDATLAKIRELHRDHPGEVRALSLSRRFGHQPSLAAGFRAARGDVVACMDGDLQHPPALLALMLYQWSQGSQVVTTRRRSQAGRPPLKSLASRLFYRAINKLSEVPIEEGAADFRLMDRVVVDALNRFGERWPFYRGLVRWAGFRHSTVDYEAPARLAGRSSYTWTRMIRLGLDAVFSFSLAPLRISHYLGGVSLLTAAGYALWTCFCWLRGGAVPGYTSQVFLVTFLGGLNLVCLGVVGEYVGRIHEQVKQRPLYLIKEVIGWPAASDAATVWAPMEGASPS
ncbi:MAG TPA: glycosyltransferase family 2 protein [Gemmataceae bacterium]|nr:glycosyltransferase family 2 protein [Gemmataceae bacterium]